MNTDRQLPPQAIESEMAVLGGIFIDNEMIEAVQGAMETNDFYRESHRLIFKAMGMLADCNEPIDLITASTLLKNLGHLEQVGGGAYLATLVDFVPMAANTLYYCRIVKEKAVRRKAIQNAQEGIEILYGGGEIEEAVAKLETAILPATDKRNTAPVGMDELIREACKKLENRYENKDRIQGLPYGIEALDRKTSGMHPGQLIIVAGRPSMGKSAFAVNCLKNVCSIPGKAGVLFTLEMDRGDNTDRLIASEGIKYHRIRNGRLKETDWAEVTRAAAKFHGMRLFIDDTPAISLKEVKAKSRRLKKDGLDFIVIDYLQLMAMTDPKANRVQGIGEISRGLKQLARELELPVMLLSQLNRAVDARPDTRPMMSDLRESGEIEQDADVILFPYRPSAYCKKCRDRVNDDSHNYQECQAEAEIILEKQRAGERNVSVRVVWNGAYQSFVGLATP